MAAAPPPMKTAIPYDRATASISTTSSTSTSSATPSPTDIPNDADINISDESNQSNALSTRKVNPAPMKAGPNSHGNIPNAPRDRRPNAFTTSPMVVQTGNRNGAGISSHSKAANKRNVAAAPMKMGPNTHDNIPNAPKDRPTNTSMFTSTPKVVPPPAGAPNGVHYSNNNNNNISNALYERSIEAPMVPNAPAAVVLAKGDYVGATFDDLVIAVINYNTARNKAHLIKERKPKRIGIICSVIKEEACEFKAYASKTPYGIRITTFSAHSCTGGPNRRQFNSSVIANIAPIDFYDNGSNNVNIRQIQDLVRNQTGFNVSSGQAHRIIHKNRNGKLLKERNELTRFLELLKKEDQDGTYKFEVYDGNRAQYAHEFRRCFIVPSGILKSVNAYNGLVSANYSTLGCGMQLILLTAHDSNNEITLLGFAICRIDDPGANADNWAWFVRNAMDVMPYLRAIVSAEVDGFSTEQMHAVLEKRSIVHLWCSSHIIEQEMYPSGQESHVGENLLAELMKARTTAHKNALLKDVADSDTRFLDWWKSVEDKCATYKLLDTYGCHRLGKIYSNTIEELGAPGDLEDKSSIDVIVGLIEHMSLVGIKRFKAAKKHEENNKVGYTYLQTLTPYAKAQHQFVLNEAETLKAIPELRETHDAATFKCTVSSTVSGYGKNYRVTLKEPFVAECDCRHFEEFLRPCAHIAAAIKEACCVTENELHYDVWRAEWFDSFWTNENLLKQHLNVVKSLKEEGSEELMKFPKKRRKRKRNYEPSTKNPRKCKRCGGTGHFAITCQRKVT